MPPAPTNRRPASPKDAPQEPFKRARSEKKKKRKETKTTKQAEG
jgi:cobaltochelatase CobT